VLASALAAVAAAFVVGAGQEGVAIPAGPALAPPAAHVADGIACQTHEQVLFHIHAHLTIFVHGRARKVPAGIGIGAPRRSVHGFVVLGSCFMWLHTHAADGVVHTESPVPRTFTLGDFFDVWGEPLGRARVGGAHGRVTAFVGGVAVPGDPRRIPLRAHAQIQLDVGIPVVAPERMVFPPGLY
jgi:hypothetical protein